MQRRVRRPFARIKTVIEKRLEPRGRQQASYVAVETCKDTKAAVLTLLVRLPGNHETGYPSPGRTGVCFGSTIVKMNSSKIKNKKTKESSSTTRRRNHTEEVHIDTWGSTYRQVNFFIILLVTCTINYNVELYHCHYQGVCIYHFTVAMYLLLISIVSLQL